MHRLLALFEQRQNLFRARNDRGRQPGEPRHLHTVRTLGDARRHLVQEHDLTAPLLDPHGVAGQTGSLAASAVSSW